MEVLILVDWGGMLKGEKGERGEERREGLQRAAGWRWG